MRFENVVIESIAYALPDNIITSDEIEQRLAPLYDTLKLPYGRLELMTGIKQRHHWPINMLPSEASALAGKRVLENSQFKPTEIDLIIHCGVCRDRLEPATAAYVHGILGLSPNAQIMDVSNACLGFLNGMLVAAGMIQSNLIRSALVVSGENGHSLLEKTIQELLQKNLSRKAIKPYFANLTIGSGATAAILSHNKIVKDPKLRLHSAVIETDSSANQLCEGGSTMDGLQMQTDSERLLESGIAVASRAWTKFTQTANWNNQSIDRVICHQVGRQHKKRLFEALALPLEKDFSTYETLGNIGSVSVPITLAKALEVNHPPPNNKITLLGIGSGLCSIMMGLES